MFDEKTGEVFKVCQQGDLFGKLALFFEEKRAASVRPKSSDARLYKLTKKDFELSVKARKAFSKRLVTADPSYSAYFETKRKLEAVNKMPAFRQNGA